MALSLMLSAMIDEKSALAVGAAPVAGAVEAVGAAEPAAGAAERTVRSVVVTLDIALMSFIGVPPRAVWLVVSTQQ